MDLVLFLLYDLFSEHMIELQ